MTDQEKFEELVYLTELQQKDERLWFQPKYITESHLQNALKALHEVILGIKNTISKI